MLISRCHCYTLSRVIHYQDLPQFADRYVHKYSNVKTSNINQRVCGGVVVEHRTPNQEDLGLIPTGGTVSLSKTHCVQT